MDVEQLKQLVEQGPAVVQWEEATIWPTAHTEAKGLHALAQYLRTHPLLAMDYLFCETCVDWRTHLTMVYHLTSTRHRQVLVLKCRLDRQQPEVDTVCDIWPTAEFHEREVFEMFGVHFTNHPDLRLLILPEGWEGKNPMRKDFEDPINMIKL